MGRLFKGLRIISEGDSVVFLVHRSKSGVVSVHSCNNDAQLWADYLQKKADDNWDSAHFWVEQHAVQTLPKLEL